MYYNIIYYLSIATETTALLLESALNTSVRVHTTSSATTVHTTHILPPPLLPALSFLHFIVVVRIKLQNREGSSSAAVWMVVSDSVGINYC